MHYSVPTSLAGPAAESKARTENRMSLEERTAATEGELERMFEGVQAAKKRQSELQVA